MTLFLSDMSTTTVQVLGMDLVRQIALRDEPEPILMWLMVQEEHSLLAMSCTNDYNSFLRNTWSSFSREEMD